jgi:hypothetical protein
MLVLSSGIGWRLQAQDLTGQWTGTATDNGSGRKQKIVLTITEGDSAVAGVLHWYFPETQYIRHLVVRGHFYSRDSVLTILEDSASAVGVGAGPGPGSATGAGPGVEAGARPEVSAGPGESGRNPVASAVNPEAGFHVLYYRRTAGHRDVLEGHYWSADGLETGKAYELAIRLEKKAPPFIPVALPPRKKKDSVQLKQYQALLDRQSPVVATIPARGSDSIRVVLYDNGEIDGDSVSLYMNNELILQHLRLAAEPKVLMVPIDKSLPVNRLVLFAENLGKLPPNTALMEVTVHGKTYELFLSTDYKRNASVEFALQE